MPTSDVCGAGSTWNAAAGECVPDITACAEGTVLVDGECVPDGSVICETGTTYNATTGKCDPDITGCAEGTVLVDGECVPYDDTLVGDITEPVEPNGYTGVPGSFTLPEIGESVTISGCITPYEDADDSGNLDPDFDLYLFSVTGQTLIDVTVDGIGGLAGAFELDGLDDQLLDGGWFRFGVNLVNDTTQRQVFLPKAGTYILAITDGRALMFGEGAGDADTCYFATVRNVAIPTPTAFATAATLLCEDTTTACTVDGTECAAIGDGICAPMVVDTMGNDVQFFSYNPDDGDILWTTMNTASEAMVPATVSEVNAGLHSFTEYDPGYPAEDFIPGLADSDAIVFAVDNYYNIGLVEADYTFTVADPGAIEMPADGEVAVTVTPPLNSWMYFEGTAGDMLHLTVTGDAANLSCRVIDVAFTMYLSSDITLATDYDEWIQLTETGTYYIQCYYADGGDYTFTTTRDHVVPTVLAVGTLIDDAALTADNVNWFELDVSGSDWLVFTADPTNFDGDLMADVYSRTNAGEIGSPNVPVVDSFGFSTTDDENARISVDDDSVFLIGISDGGTFTPAVTFDFLVDDRVFTDLGVVEEGSDIALADVALAADGIGYYLARSDVFNAVDFTVTGAAGFDTVLTHIDYDESTIDQYDDTGAAGAETFSALMLADSWVAFTVEESAGTAGTFGVGVVATEAATETEPNNTPAQGLANNLVTPDGYYASWGAVGDLDYYAITLAEGSWLSVETFDQSGPMNCAGIDSVMTIYGPDGTTELAYDDEGGVNSCSLLSWQTDAALRDMAAGTYYIMVNDYQNNNMGNYYLDIQVQMPVCGNGDIEWGETCDDNVIPPVAGDGCDEFCQIEVTNYSVSPDAAIPDVTPAGIDSIVTVGDTCTIAFITVDVDITHTYRGDLTLDITSPVGTTVTLKESGYDGTDNLIGTYPTTLTPVGDLDDFLGEAALGDWTLNVADTMTGDFGTLNAWGINLACE